MSKRIRTTKQATRARLTAQVRINQRKFTEAVELQARIVRDEQRRLFGQAWLDKRAAKKREGN
ncbi:hypothetical protein E3T46_07755 [Cryobacterium sp. Hh11]|uniref:hypothetical protein n=1 Tax=Cryobacterium sp. Hh11 TaxID=2555868 RepID=UPI00106D3E48|nr:hypothetical protein [Cryobacterium sp. Hh11]TFD51974.1 hypothetical protein E3T46_07755 [Cryobacterium sp. Hh11]